MLHFVALFWFVGVVDRADCNVIVVFSQWHSDKMFLCWIISTEVVLLGNKRLGCNVAPQNDFWVEFIFFIFLHHVVDIMNPFMYSQINNTNQRQSFTWRDWYEVHWCASVAHLNNNYILLLDFNTIRPVVSRHDVVMVPKRCYGPLDPPTTALLHQPRSLRWVEVMTTTGMHHYSLATPDKHVGRP